MKLRVSSLCFNSTTVACLSFGSTSLRSIATFLALSCALPALAAAPAKQAEDEESVLIATREAPPMEPKTSEPPADPNSLQPTAQSSDRTPELAASSETEKSSAQFGEALAKVAESQTPKTWTKPSKKISD